MTAEREALREALDMVVDATRDGTYSVSEFNRLKEIAFGTTADEDAEWLEQLPKIESLFPDQIERLERIADRLRSTPAEPDEPTEVERLKDTLDTERYRVAIGVQAIRKALDSRRWLSEGGRGSYTYDDERYQQEFGAALTEIDEALEPLRTIAGDWSDCPTDPLRVAANRTAALSQHKAKPHAEGGEA